MLQTPIKRTPLAKPFAIGHNVKTIGFLEGAILRVAGFNKHSGGVRFYSLTFAHNGNAVPGFWAHGLLVSA